MDIWNGYEQMTFDDFFGASPYKITKPIRTIELFAGIGSQYTALKRLAEEGLCKLEPPYRVVEIDKFAITSFNAIHGTDFHTMDITKLKGGDLGITEKEKYCYIMTYSFPCT